MKKGKLALALTTGLLSITAMASCNEVTYAEGIALSYEDAAGVRHNYSAKELLADYQKSKATASTDFEKIKEILIRKYYASRPADLVTIEEDAKKAVDGVKDTAKKNANDNGTQYGAELETLLKGENCDNIEELYEKKLYEIEKEKYNADYYSQAQLEAMRDGGTDKDGNGVISADEKIFPDSADWGAGSDGYIDTRMPYHVSHILVEASGCSETDPTSATLSADESRNIGQMVEYMAGASIQSSKHGLEPAATRTSFGELAKTYSKDPGSAQEFGNLGIMDKSTSFVQGFQYGVYAYDTLFNQKNAGKANLKNLKWSDKAIFSNDNGEDTYLKDDSSIFGIDGGIATIPFGAAVALADDDVADNFPTLPYLVNDGDPAFMPRNIIFNKYFNTHRIAVITPNRISYNKEIDGTDMAISSKVLGDSYSKVNELASWKGVKDASYAALPGFSVDTTGIVDVKDANGTPVNVLTTEQGKIILAVRGDSGTKGIHFIVVDRSPLVEYQSMKDGVAKELDLATYNSVKGTEDATSLSEYYTMLNPEKVKIDAFPSYKASGATEATVKTTLVTPGIRTTKTNYEATVKKIKDSVKGYNSSIDTYIFQGLVETLNVQFNTSNEIVKQIVDHIQAYSQTQRQKSIDDAQDSLDKSWTKYAEFLVREDASRELRDNGDQHLISETCAIGYKNGKAGQTSGVWAVGGACYKK